ncbi:hypothetical protein PHYSODRAFT_295644 [Phytophthora sojae]|uniref:Uncharacterized protein n=1 Tax=Phytophthora sojae (strain P6497) TaxID=1094619 RepID=G4YU21_PHYSP|nr:hypothetical protein PHYSODRAFT_295644 [Phytophthora sojae]EGZ23099.1 hypothetical protein PHYSODRAFT_295644 [Phytophthora sojae]|eukprot:XP_009518387.1 hypothetical protein PHYSODRAFT_295644 [Phytophthora sojae]
MRLMYVCARNVERSTSTKFPVATPYLSEFFFQDTQIAPRLLTTLEYACANWESVKTDWFGLFGVGEEGQEVTSKKHQRSPGATTDETLASELRRIIIGEVKNQEPSSKKSRGSSGSVERDGSVKVLVLVIDEAASLLEKKTCNGSDHLSTLRKALTEASNILQVKKRKTMILAVLVDSNPEIINAPPPFIDQTPPVRLQSTQNDEILSSVRAHSHDGRHPSQDALVRNRRGRLQSAGT